MFHTFTTAINKISNLLVGLLPDIGDRGAVPIVIDGWAIRDTSARSEIPWKRYTIPHNFAWVVQPC